MHPVAITRHGETVGYYLPVRRKRSQSERFTLRQAAARWEELLGAEVMPPKRLVLEVNLNSGSIWGVRST